jgi:hypothetical protein
MRFQPQRASDFEWINPAPKSAPPLWFIAVTMNIAMMLAAQRHSIVIADLPTALPALSKAQVMSTPAAWSACIRRPIAM